MVTKVKKKSPIMRVILQRTTQNSLSANHAEVQRCKMQ